jgi:hypothetical protein
MESEPVKSSIFRVVGVATISSFLASPSIGLAGPVLPVGGTTSGVYTNPNPTKGQNPNMVYSYSDSTSQGQSGSPTIGSGTNFKWGDASTFGVGQNQLWWNANSPLSTMTETSFKLGTLEYFNGTVVVGTTPDYIDLKIHLDLTSLDNSPINVAQDFTFKLQLITTPNTNDEDESADYVYLPSVFPSTTFNVNGVDYTLKLNGFSNIQGDGFVGTASDTEFHVKEGKWASADLTGIITSDTSGVVPEPASIVSAAVASLAGLGLAVRRRRIAALA